MDTNRLKTFAQRTRTDLMSQVARKLDAVLAPDSDARREAPEAIRTLERRIKEIGRAGVVEQVAYTWFNRFTALRYMDVNGYLTPMVVSPAPDRTRPEILDQAAAGALPDHLRPAIASKVRDLLEGRAPSREPQVEAYRLLLVAACNDLSRVMPFLFEAIADYTELLMPNELLAADGWVTRMREVMTEDACQDVEIIGWLYQFYISEKKDQVFAGLKKNQKITAENIPAATQLFTPHWIVRYLVENSLGRLWLLNRPGSKLAERMEYYIAPEEPETDFLRISGPQEIRICDPACGSGHMLTYAFDLLYAIYEEEGYDPIQIPDLILRNNLTGIEIDDRAGALAAFALAMKAATRLGRRRFLRMEFKPDIVVLQNVGFTPAEMKDVAAVVGRDLFTDEFRETLLQFEQAKNFGSLIVPKLRDPAETLRVVEARDFGGDLLLKEVQERVVTVLRMAEALSPKYHVVVANPPYMGASGMNAPLQDYAKERFPNSKSDLFAMFMERSLWLSKSNAMTAMINMQAWMFQSSYEQLRSKLLSDATILTMAHQGPRGFDTIGGEVVTTTAFVLAKFRDDLFEGSYLRLVDGNSEAEKASMAQGAIATREKHYYRATSKDFEKVPGEPIAYWINSFDIFSENPSLSEVADLKVGLQTGDNDRFLKQWFEVSSSQTRMFNGSADHYYPYSKGGEFRKWYGNREFVIDWRNDGFEIKNFRDARGKLRSRPQNVGFYFREAAEWSDIGQAKIGSRLRPEGSHFDVVAMSIFARPEVKIEHHLAFLNSTVSDYFADIVVPGMHCNTGYVGKIPFVRAKTNIADYAKKAVSVARADWDAYETSWDFTTLPLLSPDHRAETLEATYARLRAHWQGMTDEMQRLEEENNRIFIDAYSLQDELTPEVPIEEITLTCNPAYRYGVKGTEEDRETRLLADTMREFRGCPGEC